MRIEELPRYERLPGEYFALEVDCNFPDRTLAVFREHGIKARYIRPHDHIRGWFEIGRGDQWREHVCSHGDYVTFRKLADGSWSIITYRRQDFEARYRRIEP